MKVSRAQLEVWQAREELDRKLAAMTSKARREYAEEVCQRVKDALGRELRLPVVRRESFRTGV